MLLVDNQRDSRFACSALSSENYWLKICVISGIVYTFAALKQRGLMAHNKHTNKEERGVEMPVSGGGKLAVTLDQLVDYATGLDDKKDAEMMELMCYRLFARNMTPQAADKIAEIPQKFKKKNKSIIKKVITINKGDKVVATDRLRNGRSGKRQGVIGGGDA